MGSLPENAMAILSQLRLQNTSERNAGPATGLDAVGAVVCGRDLVGGVRVLGGEPEAAAAIGDQLVRILVSKARGERPPCGRPARVQGAIGEHVMGEDVIDERARRGRAARIRSGDE